MSSTRRNALVTGGTKGLGRAVALRLAAEGHQVTCVYKGDEKGRAECAEAAKAKGFELAFEKADVSDPPAVSDLFMRLAALSREPDYLVNAAGITRDAPLVFTSVVDFDAVVSGNLRSTFLTCQQAAKAMARRRFGRIVNFSSPAAILGHEGQAAYSAAKAGVLGLTRTLARELARYGVTVNAVSPGLVPTEMTAGLAEKKMAELIARTPLGRTGTPEEIAGAVRMLCDDLAGYITGQCISIDGGLT
ncbi:MAG: SDR family oxidoreductase [Myxococcaceae bacterium]